MSLESNPNDRRLDMKKRFTKAQIIGFLRETDADLTLAVPTLSRFQRHWMLL